MKTLAKIGLLALLAGLCLACSAPGNLGFDLGNPATQASSDKQILVTFPDEREDRVPVTDLTNGYRQRGGYGTSTWSLKLAQALAEEYGLHPVTQWPITALGIHCAVFEIPAQASMEETLQRLRQDKRIEAVQAMQSFQVMAQTYSDPYFKLQTGIQAMHIESAHQLATGKNIEIAVIDTGVDASHPDLAGQIALEQNFVAHSQETREDVHGTAVAGIIAASANNRQGIVGMAPGAKIIALKACWPVAPQKPEAMCNSLTLALALDRAIGLKPQIINLSLTGRTDPLVERLVIKALAEGIIVVASAGSSAGEAYFPASVAGVIAVRASGGGTSTVAGTIAAPGQEILTTLPNATYNFMSGSSFSAAHVSGLIALLLELKPHLSSAQVATLLLASMPPGLPGQLSSNVDVCAALAQAEGHPTCEGAATKAGQPLPTASRL